MRVGLQQKHIPWWTVLRLKFQGKWWDFLRYVEDVDHEDTHPCVVCGAKPGERCDAGLHS